jgi:hypothetical protein
MGSTLTVMAPGVAGGTTPAIGIASTFAGMAPGAPRGARGLAGAAGRGGGGIGAAAPRGSVEGMYGIDGDGAS